MFSTRASRSISLKVVVVVLVVVAVVVLVVTFCKNLKNGGTSQQFNIDGAYTYYMVVKCVYVLKEPSVQCFK